MPGRLGQLGARRDPDAEHDEVGGRSVRPRSAPRPGSKPDRRSRCARRCRARACASATRRTEVRVDDAQRLRARSTTVAVHPRSMNASAISRPMYPPPTMTVRRQPWSASASSPSASVRSARPGRRAGRCRAGRAASARRRSRSAARRSRGGRSRRRAGRGTRPRRRPCRWPVASWSMRTSMPRRRCSPGAGDQRLDAAVDEAADEEGDPAGRVAREPPPLEDDDLGVRAGPRPGVAAVMPAASPPMITVRNVTCRSTLQTRPRPQRDP